jgi:hypothetical protein
MTLAVVQLKNQIKLLPKDDYLGLECTNILNFSQNAVSRK